MIILELFRPGCTYAEVALGINISRHVITDRMRRSGQFAIAVEAARIIGRKKRTRGIWTRRPFRGKRPIAGKGHGGVPRFTYGRR